MDNLWTTGAPGDPGSVVKGQTPKLPRRIPLFWDFVISAVSPPGAPGWVRSRSCGGNPPFISCWQTHEARVFWTNLMWQVEREGSMDWIGLLIPLKIVVFCVILVVIYRMLSGWNSIQTPEAPGLPAASRPPWSCRGMRSGQQLRVLQTPKLPSLPPIISSKIHRQSHRAPGISPPPKLSPRKVLHYNNICVIR